MPRLAANLAAALLKSLVKFMKMEGEHGRLIKLIIYAFENISAERSAAFAGPKIPEMTRQVETGNMGRAMSTDSDASRLRP